MELKKTIFSSPRILPEELAVIRLIAKVYRDLKYALSVPSIWTGVLRKNTFARAIKGSNSIEGYNITVEDAIAAVEGEAPSASDSHGETWMAVMGYRDALTYVLQLARAPNFTFNDGFIRAFHFMMMKYDLSKNPGNWRPGSIYVRDEKKNDKVYEGPSADQVAPLIAELIRYLNSSQDQGQALIKAAMAHLNLVMIHPFSDGNGRMARCLQTLVLASRGIVDPTFCSIEEYLGSNTEDYYRVLAEVGRGSWHPENDTRTWIRFNLTAYYRQALTALRRTRTTSKLWSALEGEISSAGLNERTIFAIADAAVGMKIRSAHYRHNAEVSEVVASRDLKTMVSAGFLVPHGERRGRFYVASDSIRQMAITIRRSEPNGVMDPFVPDILAIQ
jgi:Fic family protein